VALHSITAKLTQQQQMDGVLLYLGKHSQHVGSVDISGVGDGAVTLRQLPATLQLSSLQLAGLAVQLGPHDGFQGVLGAAAPAAALKQLSLSRLEVLDGDQGLAAALAHLPAGLEHFSIRAISSAGDAVQFPTSALHQLQELTFLELASVKLHGPDEDSLPLQPLQALTRLVDLRLQPHAEHMVNASMLSTAQHLTRLDVTICSIQSGVLAGKTHLQHLQLAFCDIFGGPLLPHVQGQQQLTHHSLMHSLQADVEGNPAAAAYAALTASSKLHHLNICGCMHGSTCSRLAGSCRTCGPSASILSWRHQVAMSQLLQAAASSAAVLVYSLWTCSICSTVWSCWRHSSC
jgi:hypothetical protein